MHVFCLPLASIPYAGSFYDDKENHTLNSMLTRGSMHAYFLSGLTANFIISFLTYFIPRTSAFFMFYLAFPGNYMKPGDANLRHLGGFMVNAENFLGITINTPVKYVLLQAVIASLYVALFSSIVYAYSLHVQDKKYLIYLLPFLLDMLLDFIIEAAFGIQSTPANIMFSRDAFNSLPSYAFLFVYLVQILIFVALFISGKKKNKDIIS